MHFVNQSAFLKALGWALLDSLWQMAVLWLLYLLLTGNGKKFSARQRHSLALLSLAGGSLWFLVTLCLHLYEAVQGPLIHTIYSLQPILLSKAAAGFSVHQWLDPVLPFLSVIYLLLLVVLFIRLYRQYYHTRQLIRMEVSKAPAELRVFVQTIASRMGIRKKVRLGLSALVETPLTLGFLKPVVLLPLAAINQLNTTQVEAILLHELNHIRQNDYIINLLVACAETILFFNPFARIFCQLLHKERENSCDDMVLQFRYDAHDYASALLTLEKSRASRPALAMAATGGNQQLLLMRVKRMLTQEPAPGTPLTSRLLAYCFSALLIGILAWYNPARIIIHQVEVAQLPAKTAPAANEVAPSLVHFASETSDAPPTPSPAQKLPVVIQATRELALAAVTGVVDQVEATAVKEIEIWEQTRAGQQQVAGTYYIPTAAPAGQREYALKTVRGVQIPSTSATGVTTPFIPSNSLNYYYIAGEQDTTYPKPSAAAASQQDLTKMLIALNQLDWEKIGKNLAGTGVDITTLKQELYAAMKNVDWQKVNAEVTGSIDPETLKAVYQQYRQQRQQEKQQLELLKMQILEDRLGSSVDSLRGERKIKKIIHI